MVKGLSGRVFPKSPLVFLVEAMTRKIRLHFCNVSCSAAPKLNRIQVVVWSRRPGAEESGHHERGLGLGVFIARTLLERTGARVLFSNRAFPDHGAVVQIAWPRQRFEEPEAAGETAS